MKKIERLDTEVKIGKIIDKDGEMMLVEFDRDENQLDTFTIDELLKNIEQLPKEFIEELFILLKS